MPAQQHRAALVPAQRGLGHTALHLGWGNGGQWWTGVPESPSQSGQELKLEHGRKGQATRPALYRCYPVSSLSLGQERGRYDDHLQADGRMRIQTQVLVLPSHTQFCHLISYPNSVVWGYCMVCSCVNELMPTFVCVHMCLSLSLSSPLISSFLYIH